MGALPDKLSINKENWEKLNKEMSFETYKGKALPPAQVRYIVSPEHQAIIHLEVLE